MRVDDIRVFMPSKDYDESIRFYTALGFTFEYVTDDLSLMQNGDCTFFLQRFYHPDFAQNLMLQISVIDIVEAYETISRLPGDVKFEPIKVEHWGKVVYVWGPAGELLHITEFTPAE